MEEDGHLLLDQDLGFVQDCDVCASLRSTLAALSEKHEAAVKAAAGEADDPDSEECARGMVHPNEFLLVFARRQIHEGETGHVALGWRWVREARAVAKQYIQEGGPTRAFWADFMRRHLGLPIKGS
jgi:hypothetical protein